MSRGAVSTLLMGLALSSLGGGMMSGGMPYGMKKDRLPSSKRKSQPPKNTRLKCSYCRARKIDAGVCGACGRKAAV
jgi:hypothetical protein